MGSFPYTLIDFMYITLETVGIPDMVWEVSISYCNHCYLDLPLLIVLGDITVQPQNITVLQGQIAAFECKAENSLPRTTVTWYKDSIQLNVLTDSMYVSDVTGTLFVRDVGVEDAGGYHCVCENGAGQVTSRVANLTPATSIEREWWMWGESLAVGCSRDCKT